MTKHTLVYLGGPNDGKIEHVTTNSPLDKDRYISVKCESDISDNETLVECYLYKLESKSEHMHEYHFGGIKYIDRNRG